MTENLMTNEELTRTVLLDPKATDRERLLAERLEDVIQHLDSVQLFLVRNDLVETERVLIQ